MTDTVIKVENLSKQYRIGAREKYKTFRETLVDAAKAPLKGIGSLFSRDSSHVARHAETIWALKDVSFEVKQGEVLGIIGRNGAGKSTLLKILSKITEPTEGRVELRGRVGSLLEVGTGFHPELTGHENIYLYGAILGMDRWEVTRKFDEIVAFAELEKFIDTPVKRYSSGMYMRLAFAVAAHLEPEILLVDEVLAVGDAAFQKKCLGKMGDVSKEGRTVLFVSHNLAAIIALCSRSLLLESGNLSMDGGSVEVTQYYQTTYVTLLSESRDLTSLAHRGTNKAVFSSLVVKPYSTSAHELPLAYTGCDLIITAVVKSVSGIVDANVALVLYDSAGYRLVDMNTAQKGIFLSLAPESQAEVIFHVKELLLKPGLYLLGLWLGRGGLEEIDSIEHAARLEITGNPEMQKHTESFPGPYLCRFESRILRLKEETN
jgi:lipopolysaccharide transport system ATP-binding protein